MYPATCVPRVFNLRPNKTKHLPVCSGNVQAPEAVHSSLCGVLFSGVHSCCPCPRLGGVLGYLHPSHGSTRLDLLPGSAASALNSGQSFALGWGSTASPAWEVTGGHNLALKIAPAGAVKGLRCWIACPFCLPVGQETKGEAALTSMVENFIHEPCVCV